MSRVTSVNHQIRQPTPPQTGTSSMIALILLLCALDMGHGCRLVPTAGVSGTSATSQRHQALLHEQGLQQRIIQSEGGGRSMLSNIMDPRRKQMKSETAKLELLGRNRAEERLRTARLRRMAQQAAMPGARKGRHGRSMLHGAEGQLKLSR